MTHDPLFPAFAVLMTAIIVWLGLVWKLFAMMKLRAADAYASIGRPHVILNNTIRNNVAFLRFLLGGHYTHIGDDGVRRLCALLRVSFWLYLAGLVAFAAVILGKLGLASSW